MKCQGRRSGKEGAEVPLSGSKRQGFRANRGRPPRYGLSVGERDSAGRERVNRSDIAGLVAGGTGVGRSVAEDALDAVNGGGS